MYNFLKSTSFKVIVLISIMIISVFFIRQQDKRIPVSTPDSNKNISPQKSYQKNSLDLPDLTSSFLHTDIPLLPDAPQPDQPEAPSEVLTVPIQTKKPSIVVIKPKPLKVASPIQSENQIQNRNVTSQKPTTSISTNSTQNSEIKTHQSPIMQSSIQEKSIPTQTIINSEFSDHTEPQSTKLTITNDQNQISNSSEDFIKTPKNITSTEITLPTTITQTDNKSTVTQQEKAITLSPEKPSPTLFTQDQSTEILENIVTDPHTDSPQTPVNITLQNLSPAQASTIMTLLQGSDLPKNTTIITSPSNTHSNESVFTSSSSLRIVSSDASTPTSTNALQSSSANQNEMIPLYYTSNQNNSTSENHPSTLTEDGLIPMYYTSPSSAKSSATESSSHDISSKTSSIISPRPLSTDTLQSSYSNQNEFVPTSSNTSHKSSSTKVLPSDVPENSIFPENLPFSSDRYNPAKINSSQPQSASIDIDRPKTFNELTLNPLNDLYAADLTEANAPASKLTFKEMTLNSANQLTSINVHPSTTLPSHLQTTTSINTESRPKAETESESPDPVYAFLTRTNRVTLIEQQSNVPTTSNYNVTTPLISESRRSAASSRTSTRTLQSHSVQGQASSQSQVAQTQISSSQQPQQQSKLYKYEPITVNPTFIYSTNDIRKLGVTNLQGAVSDLTRGNQYTWHVHDVKHHNFTSDNAAIRDVVIHDSTALNPEVSVKTPSNWPPNSVIIFALTVKNNNRMYSGSYMVIFTAYPIN